MKITKIQAAIIIVLLVLIAVIAMNRPHKTPPAANPTAVQPQESEQSVGKYELPPETKDGGTYSQDMASTINTEKQNTTLKTDTKKTAAGTTVSSGGDDPGTEPQKPGKYPTPDQTRQMMEKGIVLF